MNLRKYQKEAIKAIYDSIENGDKKIRIAMAVGTGRTAVMVAFAGEQVEHNKKILILSPNRSTCEELRMLFEVSKADVSICSTYREYMNENILITTYKDMGNNTTNPRRNVFDIMICDGIQFEKSILKNLYSTNKIELCLGFTSSMDEVVEGWFDDSKLIYRYSSADAIVDGYSFPYREYRRVENYCRQLLEKTGFKIQEILADDMWGDIKAIKSGQECLIEIKTYKSPQISLENLNRVVKQAIEFQEKFLQESKIVYLFMFCEVKDSVKKKIYEENHIVTIDIANFLYLSKADERLHKELVELIPFSIDSIEEHDVIDEEKLLRCPGLPVTRDEEENICNKYIEELEKCALGRASGEDKEYERICSKIVKELFAADFAEIKEQFTTYEGLFRMDMICAIKLNSKDTFWGFLKQFYQTNFVVFEFKNYTETVSQNLICTTEKYLSATALRKVAFIISRKGFDNNSRKIALRSLKDHGNLIISLIDEDLIRMLTIKNDGREPSSYLMDKVNTLLMEVN